MLESSIGVGRAEVVVQVVFNCLLRVLIVLRAGVWGSCRNALKIDGSVFEGIPSQDLGES